MAGARSTSRPTQRSSLRLQHPAHGDHRGHRLFHLRRAGPSHPTDAAERRLARSSISTAGDLLNPNVSTMSSTARCDRHSRPRRQAVTRRRYRCRAHAHQRPPRSDHWMKHAPSPHQGMRVVPGPHPSGDRRSTGRRRLQDPAHSAQLPAWRPTPSSLAYTGSPRYCGSMSVNVVDDGALLHRSPLDSTSAVAVKLSPSGYC